MVLFGLSETTVIIVITVITILVVFYFVGTSPIKNEGQLDGNYESEEYYNDEESKEIDKLIKKMGGNKEKINYDKSLENVNSMETNFNNNLSPYQWSDRKYTVSDQYDLDALMPKNDESYKDKGFDNFLQINAGNLIDTRMSIGIDTVSASNKNKSRDLRGDTHPNPRGPGPSCLTSIEPDEYTYKGLCNS